MTVITNRATVDRMLRDGKIDLDTASTINRFAAFLRAAGPAPKVRDSEDDKAVRAGRASYWPLVTPEQKLEILTDKYGPEMAAYMLDPEYDGELPGEHDNW